MTSRTGLDDWSKRTLLAEAHELQAPGGLFQPIVAGRHPAALVEHDLTVGDRGLRTIDDRQRLVHGEGIEPRDKEDVVRAVREPLGVTHQPAAEIVGVVDAPSYRHRLARHLAVEQRELGIDAGDGAVEPGGPGHADGHPFGEDDVEDAVLERRFHQRRGDRLFDRRRICRARDLFVDRRADANHVGLRNRALANVVLPDPLRAGTRLVDDHRDVLGRLCVRPMAGRQEHHHAQTNAPSRRSHAHVHYRGPPSVR